MSTPMEPTATAASTPFWEASRQRQLVLPWCTACGAAVFYPREVCPRCLAEEWDWRPASGRGTVYAASVHHRPAGPHWADRVPYVVALVELEEGVRLMSNVIGCAPEEVTVGMAVRVTWAPMSDGRHLPQFEPDAGQ